MLTFLKFYKFYKNKLRMYFRRVKGRLQTDADGTAKVGQSDDRRRGPLTSRQPRPVDHFSARSTKKALGACREITRSVTVYESNERCTLSSHWPTGGCGSSAADRTPGALDDGDRRLHFNTLNQYGTHTPQYCVS